MDGHKRQARKAVGSSDIHNTAAQQKQPRKHRQQPQAQSCTSERLDHETIAGVQPNGHVIRHTASQRSEEELLQLPSRLPSPSHHPGQTTSSSTFASDDETLDSEWAILPAAAHRSYLDPSPSTIPKAWTTALTETTTALTHIHRASSTYATALAQSGMGKAGRCIASALVAEGSKKAVGVAGWVGGKTGWLGKAGLGRMGEDGGREKKDREVERGMKIEKRDGGMKEQRVFGDEQGRFVLEMWNVDGFEEEAVDFEEEDGWMAAEVEGGVGREVKNMAGRDEGSGEEGDEHEGDRPIRVFEFDE